MINWLWVQSTKLSAITMQRTLKVIPQCLLLLLPIWAGLLTGCNREALKRERLAEGNKYYGQGNFKMASTMYSKAIEVDQRFGEAYYRLGLAQLQLNQLPAAEGSFHTFFDLVWRDGNIVSREAWPQVADAAVKVSDIYLKIHPGNRDYMNGIGYWSSVLLKADVNSFDGHRLLAEFLRFQSMSGNRDALQSAIGEFRRANQLKPDNDSVLLALAGLLAYDHRYPEAEQIYWGLIKAHRSIIPAYTHLYETVTAQNVPARATSILAQAIQSEGGNYQLFTSLAEQCFKTGTEADVLTILHHMEERAAEFHFPYFHLGALYERLGNLDGALQQYRNGLKVDPQRATKYREKIIEMLLAEGRTADARSDLAPLLAASQPSYEVRLLNAWLEMEEGSLTAAVTELEKLRAENPSDPVLLCRLGKAFEREDKHELAVQVYNQALKVQPGYLPAFLGLSELYLGRGQYYLAQKSAEDALAKERLNARAKSLAAAIQQKRGETARPAVSTTAYSSFN